MASTHGPLSTPTVAAENRPSPSSSGHCFQHLPLSFLKRRLSLLSSLNLSLQGMSGVPLAVSSPYSEHTLGCHPPSKSWSSEWNMGHPTRSEQSQGQRDGPLRCRASISSPLCHPDLDMAGSLAPLRPHSLEAHAEVLLTTGPRSVVDGNVQPPPGAQLLGAPVGAGSSACVCWYLDTELSSAHGSGFGMKALSGNSVLMGKQPRGPKK